MKQATEFIPDTIPTDREDVERILMAGLPYLIPSWLDLPPVEPGFRVRLMCDDGAEFPARVTRAVTVAEVKDWIRKTRAAGVLMDAAEERLQDSRFYEVHLD